MRTIGHFVIFVAFFLLVALVLGLVVLGAAMLRSALVLLALVPLLPGLYLAYSRGCRAVLSRAPVRR